MMTADLTPQGFVLEGMRKLVYEILSEPDPRAPVCPCGSGEPVAIETGDNEYCWACVGPWLGDPDVGNDVS